uniref:Large ribosomal subunit protein uL22c n=1 Tax=Tetraclinis articulata TaxID=13717 RepID=A0A6J4AHY7_9CONI|nr:ribosomal protein L22 [Tetraclinis articulata]BBN67026.1 ribosomal protein L22 [Tetraclinis articulata]
MKMKFIFQNRDLDLNSTIRIRAVAKHVRMSSNKARRVVHLLRNSTYIQALAILTFMDYRACEPIFKVLVSAAENACSFMGIHKCYLAVLAAEVNEGPTLKRFRPRARGRGYPIQKSTCHISITLFYDTSLDFCNSTHDYITVR